MSLYTYNDIYYSGVLYLHILSYRHFLNEKQKSEK